MGRGAGGGKGGDQGEHAARHTYRTQSRARVSQALTHVRPARRWATPGGLMQLAVIPKVGAGWGSASRPDLCRGCRVTGIPTALNSFAQCIRGLCSQRTNIWDVSTPHPAHGVRGTVLLLLDFFGRPPSHQGVGKDGVPCPRGSLRAREAALRQMRSTLHGGPTGRVTGLALRARQGDRAVCGDRRRPTRPCVHGGR